MEQRICKVISNQKIARDIIEMIIESDTAAITRPGQFINIKLDELFLRRPISVCDYDESTITIIYKVIGSGTETLSRLKAGDALDVLVGLGNGYDTSQSGQTPLLIGGGVGVPPMYNLCRKLVEEGKQPRVILGFNTAEDVFYEEEFKALGAQVLISTVDGSYGVKGYVTDAMNMVDEYSYFYTCGPMPMLKAVNTAAKATGQFSFEERMGCGFGACMGCSCKTKYGSKRICKEGPVLFKEEIIW